MVKNTKDIFVTSLLQNGQVTFTTKGKEFQHTLEQAKILGIKTRIEQYTTFVVIVNQQTNCKYARTKTKIMDGTNIQPKRKGELKMKNWTVKEAVKVIGEGKDQEAIKEIVKHFPLFAVIVAGKDFDAFAAAMPDHVTVRKIENELNAGGNDTDVDENTDGVDEAEDTGDEDLSAMSTKQLIALCGKRGIKVPKYGKNKQFYLDALAGGAEDADEPEAEEDEEEDDPVALYKQCKKAGLKVAPKKSAKYYKDALKKAEQEAEDDEDDWDDEDDEEEEKPVKKPAKSSKGSKSTGKPSGKGKSKAKPEPEEEDEVEDDDEDGEDDWDI